MRAGVQAMDRAAATGEEGPRIQRHSRGINGQAQLALGSWWVHVQDRQLISQPSIPSSPLNECLALMKT